MKHLLIFACLVFAFVITAISEEDPLRFEIVSIDDNADLWWARAFADINNDGVLDIALQNNNGHGGWLGWLEAKDDGKHWQRHIIIETAPNGEPFACGDLDAGDIDGDGDADILRLSTHGGKDFAAWMNQSK